MHPPLYVGDPVNNKETIKSGVRRGRNAKRGRRSNVWKYFVEFQESLDCRCLLCNKVIRRKASTTVAPDQGSAHRLGTGFSSEHPRQASSLEVLEESGALSNAQILWRKRDQGSVASRPIPSKTRSKVYNFFVWDESIRQWRCKLCEQGWIINQGSQRAGAGDHFAKVADLSSGRLQVLFYDA
ncbi:unnamed protein product [Orchesella dallaii]|uniref:BED-type domain-containing protein n=1 Tax=Orchesella dallaii TaxID=48710 RepID=A0ABP1QRS7_9HEXA